MAAGLDDGAAAAKRARRLFDGRRGGGVRDADLRAGFEQKLGGCPPAFAEADDGYGLVKIHGLSPDPIAI